MCSMRNPANPKIGWLVLSADHVETTWVNELDNITAQIRHKFAYEYLYIYISWVVVPTRDLPREFDFGS